MIQEPEYGQEMDDQELVTWFFKRFRDSEAHFQWWRSEADVLYKMYSGRGIYSEADSWWLNKTKRTEINVNLTLGTLNSIIGAQMSDRKEVQFRGVEEKTHSGVIAEWLTQVLRTAYQACFGHRKETEASLDMLITGYGYTEGYLDATRLPMIAKLEIAPPWEVFADPDALEDNLSDSRFIIRRRHWDIEEAQAKWPDKKDEISAAAVGMNMSLPSTYPESVTLRRSVSEHRANRVPIYQFQYVRYVTYVAYIDPGGQQVSMPKEVAKENWKLAGEEPRVVHEYPHKCYYQAFITGSSENASGSVLERSKLSTSRFTIQPVTGYKEKDLWRERGLCFGPARTVVDLQRYINRSYSVYLDILARGSKGGFIVETDAIPKSREDFEAQASTPGGVISVKPGALAEGKIQERGTQSPPTGIDQFLRLLVNSFEQVTGVGEYLKGTSTSERSNVYVSNMQQQSYTMLAPLYDPITKFQIENGKLLMEIILQHYTEDQINRILGDQDEVEGLTHQLDPETNELVPVTTPAQILKGVTLDDFEVTADVGQASTTQKQMFANLWVQTDLIGTLSNLLGDHVGEVLPDLVRYMPLPPSVSDGLATKLEKAFQMQKEGMDMDMMMQQLSEMPPEQLQQMIMEAQQQQASQGQPPGPPNGQPPM
jgi:hypothetical protein